MAAALVDDGDGVDQEKIGNLPRVWGPLPLAVTSAFRAHAPVRSFVVRPVLKADLLAAVEAEVLHGAIPAPDETREALLQRLQQSTPFDNPRIVFSRRTKHGCFRYQSDVPPREGGQPRRATFGEVSQPSYVDESGELVARKRGYFHLYRHHEEPCMCRPMPPSLLTLRDELYTQVCGHARSCLIGS